MLNLTKNMFDVFDNGKYKIRGVIINNEPYFVGKDIALALGYKNTNDAIKTHVDEEDKGSVKKLRGSEIRALDKNTILINESGMYALIFGSKNMLCKN